MRNERFVISNHRSIIKFILILLASYLLFSQANLFMNSAVSPGGKFYNEFVANNLNYIQGMRYALIVPSTWILKIFGYQTIYNHSEILVIGGPLIRVNYSCLGFGVISFLAAFIIAFPATLKASIQMLLLGTLLIFCLNVFRIAALSVLMSKYHSQIRYFNYHHEIFNISIYIIIFLLLLRWVKINTESQTPLAPSNLK